MAKMMTEPCYIRYAVVSVGQYIGTSFADHAEAQKFMLETFEHTGTAGMDVLLFLRNGSDDVLLARKQIFSMSRGGEIWG